MSDDEVCVCGHARFYHRLIFEATARLGRCHFCECQCQQFRQKGLEEKKK